ncbi:hypothetical protein ACFWIA_23255 [Streptomyces sp. NPDC127068]|uniref:hypothetical protein n=1 Tax=Streptomyces sp. NPDC127068 TaxID=3347127 RepID=UPI0036604D3E
MHSDIAGRKEIDAPTAEAFSAALDRFSTSLSDADRAILVAVLNAAMGPWERMAAHPVEKLLDPADARLVEQLVERARSEER